MTRTLVATLLSASFAFQILVAERVACTTAGSGGSASSAMPAAGGAMPAMAGMDRGLPMSTPASPSGESSAPERVPHHPPCDQATSPVTCQLMAPCAVLFVPVPAATLGSDVLVSARVVAAHAEEPSSHTDPPDLPPPRA
jgi:hypothetical protein